MPAAALGCGGALTTAVPLEQGEAPGCEFIEGARELIERIDAHGIQVIPERGLDCAFPAGCNPEGLGETRALGKPRAFEPFPGTTCVVAERRLLQGLER